MLRRLKQLVGQTSPIRLAYHRAKAIVANVRYGVPARGMVVLGVTGTNGKTTTTTLLGDMLHAAGIPVAVATTIQFRVRDRVWTNETHKTTLSASSLMRFIRDARREGCTHLVLEVSSHALLQGRVIGVPFQTAVFTNLSPEHLDYHRTMDAYQAAKEILFRRLRNRTSSCAIVNADDPRAGAFLQHRAEHTWLTHVADAPLAPLPQTQGRHTTLLEATDAVTAQASTSFTLRWAEHALPVTMQLLGRFNIENALSASAAALAHGVDPAIIQRVLAEVPLIPGRLEPVEVGQQFRALIDYAVTPDSLAKLYATLRPITTGRILTVFGACGDRDRSKRPEMGRVAGEMADVVILTNEEPYSEDPQSILDQIAPGVRRTSKREGEDFWVILDRKAAIDHAVSLARPGDTIVVSGMGNQTSMVWGDRVLPWSDRDELSESITRIVARA